jgi:AraC family transcriptional regulator
LRYSPTCFPAPVVRRRATGDFVLSETRYGSDAALPTHAHEYACLVVALSGHFEERCGAATRTIEPGTVIVRPEGEPHSDRFTRSGARCLNVELPPEWLSRVRELAQPLDRSGAYRGGAFALTGRRLHAELVNGDDVSPLAVESLILALFADAARESRRTPAGAPAWLVDVRERMHDDPAARITLGGLAASAGVHPVHLATTFRRYYGATVAAYLRQLRIDFACRELSRTDAPIVDVALAAGFADQSHFGRTFKQAMRTTPAAYRAAARG